MSIAMLYSGAAVLWDMIVGNQILLFSNITVVISIIVIKMILLWRRQEVDNEHVPSSLVETSGGRNLGASEHCVKGENMIISGVSFKTS